MDVHVPDPAVSAVMSRIRSRDTQPELRLRSLLHRRGLRFRVCHQLPLPQVRRTADVVFTRARVAVFVDGDFWHGCPTHYRLPKTNQTYWAPKIERNRRRDEQVNRLLTEAGWKVMRVWECEDPEVAADRIEATVLARRPA